MIFSEEMEQLSKQYKKLFILDGIGALISAFFLGIVLVIFQEHVGIPANSLYILALFPIFFFIYDSCCYLKVTTPSSAAFHLRIVAILNLLYILLSIGFTVYHFSLIKQLGFIYIVCEILIISCIAFIELKVAKTIAPRLKH